MIIKLYLHNYRILTSTALAAWYRLYELELEDPSPRHSHIVIACQLKAIENEILRRHKNIPSPPNNVYPLKRRY